MWVVSGGCGGGGGCVYESWKNKFSVMHDEKEKLYNTTTTTTTNNNPPPPPPPPTPLSITYKGTEVSADARSTSAIPCNAARLATPSTCKRACMGCVGKGPVQSGGCAPPLDGHVIASAAVAPIGGGYVCVCERVGGTITTTTRATRAILFFSFLLLSLLFLFYL